MMKELSHFSAGCIPFMKNVSITTFLNDNHQHDIIPVCVKQGSSLHNFSLFRLLRTVIERPLFREGFPSIRFIVKQDQVLFI